MRKNLFRIFCYSQSESPFALSYYAKEGTSQKGRLSTPNFAKILPIVESSAWNVPTSEFRKKMWYMNVLTSISTPTSTQLVEFICLNSKLRTLNPADLEVSIASCLKSRHLCIGNLLFFQIWPWQRSRGSLGWLRLVGLAMLGGKPVVNPDSHIGWSESWPTINLHNHKLLNQTFFPSIPPCSFRNS